MDDLRRDDCFAFQAEMSIRPCRREDLPALAWMGLYSRDGELFAATLARQDQGRSLMLLGICNGFPIAQVFVDWPHDRIGSVYFWAVRTFFPFHGLGIGSMMMRRAERIARSRRCLLAELEVDPADSRARRFYEKLGYVAGAAEGLNRDLIVMRKTLGDEARAMLADQREYEI